jgi:hypothetical protein
MLTLGGRLPLAFAPAIAGDTLVFVDRSIRRIARDLSVTPASVDVGDRWWLGQLDRPQVRLNAMLCGLEGASRRAPTEAEFAAVIRDDSRILRAAFPNATVVEYDSERMREAYRILATFEERRSREAAFLVQVAASIAQRPPRRARQHLEGVIRELAARHAVPLTSLAVLCALSCIYESPASSEGSIGRGVLKPHASFAEGDAYNAVADVQALEVLAVSLAVAGGKASLLTRDRALANLWLCLHLDGPVFGEEQFRATLRPGPELFPDLSEDDVRALVTRLAS